jgi:RNA polymerase sigma factor (sigma-70 family)
LIREPARRGAISQVSTGKRLASTGAARHRSSTTQEQHDIGAARHRRSATQEQHDWDRLDRAIEAISTQHREIVRLHYFAELSDREIDEALSIPAGTVVSRLYLARLVQRSR